METLLPISLGYLPALGRIGGIMACAPLFSSPAVPRKVRAAIALALTIALAPARASDQPLAALALGIVSEVAIGIAIGISLNLVFIAAQWGGELIAQQMGIGLAEHYDLSHSHGSSLSGAYSLLMLVVFLAVNGHHALIRGIGASFQSLPVLSAISGQSIVNMLASLLTSACGLALQLAAPIFVTLLVADLAIGMIGKTVPQVGLMTAGITIRAIVGLVMLVMCMALTTTLLQSASLNWMQVVQNATAGLAR